MGQEDTPNTGSAGGVVDTHQACDFEILQARRKMVLVTLTDQEAKSLQTVGRGVSVSWSFASLFVGLLIPILISLLSKGAEGPIEVAIGGVATPEAAPAAIEPWVWLLLGIVLLGIVLSIASALWFHSRHGSMLQQIEKED